MTELLDNLGTRCGLNADWCISAWHLSAGTPNMKSGDVYVLDDEDGDDTYSLVRRWYADDGHADPERPDDSNDYVEHLASFHTGEELMQALLKMDFKLTVL